MPSINRRSFFAAAGVAAVAAAVPITGIRALAAGTPAVAFHNPLAEQRADPYIIKHDGTYYFTATVPVADRIFLRKSSTLQGLGSAQEITIWNKHESGEMSANIWAPELHRVNGNWYIYFAAGRTDDGFRIRMYVLENTSEDPTTGTWTEKGQITTHADGFSLDATTFFHGDEQYLCWTQYDPEPDGTSLYLATMADPWTLKSDPVRISMPEYDWEKYGHIVDEGPAVLKRNGRVFITFSASWTGAEYKLGLLTASEDADLLDASSWSKNPQPVFQSHDGASQYGPGHNSFTVSEDGQSDILVYHARPYKDIDGNPLDNPDRHTRLQKLYWNADGTPNFGIPVPDGPTPFRFLVHGGDDRYLNHFDSRLRAGEPAMLADSQFMIVAGLAGSGSVSLRSANYPDRYLRHRNGEFWLDAFEDTDLYKQDASFQQRAGLADSNGVSFQSVNYPDYYLRRSGDYVDLGLTGTTAEQSDATFFLE
ncbi:family 43 glycosylhydrolase [Glycomyces tenuis]|uniref:family 43 glycosylhydrolase n=1 Tax=Glycomyces tenuis TaxID=58116 RepID=UPI000426AF3E|nr:family 43 glycosylhydrolase [Glycomyces tenuis]